MTHAAEGLFLQQLFERFNESAIRYAVVRNHEPLPLSAGGSDLNIIVSQQDDDRATQVAPSPEPSSC
jgi:hypothetical protein